MGVVGTGFYDCGRSLCVTCTRDILVFAAFVACRAWADDSLLAIVFDRPDGVM